MILCPMAKKQPEDKLFRIVSEIWLDHYTGNTKVNFIMF